MIYSIAVVVYSEVRLEVLEVFLELIKMALRWPVS